MQRGEVRPGGTESQYSPHQMVAYRKHACLPRQRSWVRNPVGRPLGFFLPAAHYLSTQFLLRARAREGYLTIPDELWRRLRRCICGGTVTAATPPCLGLLGNVLIARA